MQEFQQIGERARAASLIAASLSTDLKNEVLQDVSVGLESQATRIKEANNIDVASATSSELPPAKLRRLTLTDELISQMATGMRQVAELPDPVGQITREYTVPSGLIVKRVRCPIGVILMIYEARPNVTVDAFALCFKSGNACILKGGREAAHTNQILAEIIHSALKRRGITPDVLTLVTSTDREDLKSLLQMTGRIDLVIPRGGTELISFVHEHSRIPTIQHFKGVCHIFVDETADQMQAIEICTKAKTSSPAACNAVEALLVHANIANVFIPKLLARLLGEGVEVRGDETVTRLSRLAVPAKAEDWGREFLDLIVAIKVVQNIDGAIAHISQYGTNHTESILSENAANQDRFVREIQSSCTLVNASTRFNDGFQLGLGAEIGISTSKIHAYGPMGLEELTTQRYVAIGSGQAR